MQAKYTIPTGEKIRITSTTHIDRDIYAEGKAFSGIRKRKTGKPSKKRNSLTSVIRAKMFPLSN